MKRKKIKKIKKSKLLKSIETLNLSKEIFVKNYNFQETQELVLFRKVHFG